MYTKAAKKRRQSSTDGHQTEASGQLLEPEAESRIMAPPPFQLRADGDGPEAEEEEVLEEATTAHADSNFASPDPPASRRNDGMVTGLETMAGLDQAQLRSQATQRRAASSTAPIQRLAVQVHDKLDGSGRISEVQVAGRPDSVFSGSMGDHTTAFSVHAEGIKQQLTGQTYAEGFRTLKDLKGKLANLPGYKLIANLEDSHRERFDAALAKLEAELQAIEQVLAPSEEAAASSAASASESKGGDSANNSYLASQIQKIVHHYLEVRELIPLSTFNIREKSALGGRGKGEGRYVDVLRNYKAAQDASYKGPSNAEAEIAIEKMFDLSSSAAVLGTANPQMLSQMAPGVVPKPDSSGSVVAAPDPAKMLGEVWTQHLLSIETSFPEVAAIAKSSKMADKFKGGNVKEVLGGEAMKDLGQELISFNTSLEEIQKQYGMLAPIQKKGRDAFAKAKAEGNLTGKKGVVAYLALNAAKEECDAAIERVVVIESLLSALGSSEGKKGHSGLLKQVLADVWGGIDALWKADAGGAADAKVEAASFQTGAKYHALLDSARAARDQSEATSSGDNGISYVSETQKTALQTARGGMGVQISVDEDGIIDGFESDGRTQSPFKGTMGAHTIAWVLHIEHIKKGMVGKSLDEALAHANTDLLAFMGKVEQTLDAGNKGNAAQKSRRGELGGKIREMGAQITSKTIPGAKLPFLQTFISNILAYTNLIPGITRIASNTNGRGEPAAKQGMETFQAEAEAFFAPGPHYGEAGAKEAGFYFWGFKNWLEDKGVFQKAEELQGHIKVLREPAGTPGIIGLQSQMVAETYPYVSLLIQLSNNFDALLYGDEDGYSSEEEEKASSRHHGRQSASQSGSAAADLEDDDMDTPMAFTPAVSNPEDGDEDEDHF